MGFAATRWLGFATRYWLKRVIVGLWLRPRSHCPLTRLGSDYGGWWVPAQVLRPECVAYCAGIGNDVSFDLALAERGCKVTSFDPTPVAVAFMSSCGPSVESLRYVPIGWWDEECRLEFFVPPNPSAGAYSAVNQYGTTSVVECCVKAVHQLMQELGDDEVDVVKMDIEGAEHRVLDSMLKLGPRPIALCVEFDYVQPIGAIVGATHKLRAAGYRLERIERYNFTFVRR